MTGFEMAMVGIVTYGIATLALYLHNGRTT